MSENTIGVTGGVGNASRASEVRLFLLLVTAALGAGASIGADRILRGDERAEQFAAVQEILTRVERKVDVNSARSERDFSVMRTRISDLTREHQRELSENRTNLAVLVERVGGLEEQWATHARDDEQSTRGKTNAD